MANKIRVYLRWARQKGSSKLFFIAVAAILVFVFVYENIRDAFKWAGANAVVDIIKSFLDWPFLLFLFLSAFAYFFREQIQGILNRGDIAISWGEGRTIRLRDLSEHVDEDMGEIVGEVENLKEKIEKMEKWVLEREPAREENEEPSLSESAPSGEGISGSLSGSDYGSSPLSPPLDDSARQNALNRMRDELTNGKYRWRTIDRLAVRAGITEAEALGILSSERDVILGQNMKSGSRIARLETG